jgi:hypothetical protein
VARSPKSGQNGAVNNARMLVAALATVGCLAAASCKVKDPPAITEPFSDAFQRNDLGGNWNATGSGYRLVDGQLSARGAKNHPLWLRRKLPRDVRIELDAWSNERRGDIKVEIFGDGSSFDADGGSYTATGYALIFGGWSNSKSLIARLDEHGNDVVERADVKVVAKQKYRWRIERKGQVLDWYIDDMSKPFLSYDDRAPLAGDGHESFAINNWETDTYFDNLVITPL